MINIDLLRGLQGLGLTNREAEALVAVVMRGHATAADVSREIGVHYPVVYRLLASLERKGWIESSNDRPRIYRSRDVTTAVTEAAGVIISEIQAEAEKVRKGLLAVKGSKQPSYSVGTWIMKGWDIALKKARELARKAKRCVYVVGKDPIDEKELEDLLKSLSASSGYINLYLIADQDYGRLKRSFPEVNYQITLRNFKADPTRFVSLFIIFDEREALFINACYRKGILEKDKVYATWEKNQDVIDILIEGNNLKLKGWSLR